MFKWIKQRWIDFWVSKGRCPKCFRNFWCFHENYSNDFGYCPKHMWEAYYEDGTKVEFRD